VSDTDSHHVTVRRVEVVEDTTGLLALVRDHIRFERSSAVVPDDWAERTDAHLRAGRLRVFVAEHRGRAVGYAGLTEELSTWTGRVHAHLDCLYLDSTHRGRGIGRDLVTTAVEDAWGRGLVEVQWQTPSWNRPAIALYERLGARRVSKERFTLGQQFDATSADP
jgi:ribosomal protein S18 acetylase RimI-like enzyme